MPTPELRPPADHESADVRVVAPVNAGQQGGTYSQFRSWLFDELERLRVKRENPGASCTPDQDESDYLCVCTAMGVMARFDMERRA